MNSIIKSKVSECLKSERNLQIINASDFYFQKARDVLQNFLNLEVSEETKMFLLKNKKEYNELKQLFIDSLDLQEFGRLLFSLIAYCDSNAYNKNKLNEYIDKRVLALAFVRMNNWVEQLIDYKFNNTLVDGSIKNAIDYLNNPIDNFTMLSENHRNQISENLFRKPYNKHSFKDDFINFFSFIPIQPNNAQNYTYLLTSISYQIDSEWKSNIIGLISPDRTGWQTSAINDSKNGNHIALWNHKKPNGTSTTLKLLRECIADNGFFRIFYTSNYQVNYVAEIIDFVTNQNELEKSKWPEHYGKIEWYNDDFGDYNSDNKTASWIYLARSIYKVDSNDYGDFNYYKSFSYPSVGCQAPVTTYKNNKEIKKQKDMNDLVNLLQYKKQIILQGPPGTGKTRKAKGISKQLLNLSDDKKLENNEQFKLVQFHSSYTYEDFVSGIVAESKGDKVEYKNVNKTLGLFAKEALENYNLSRDNNHEAAINKWVDEKFEEFKVDVEQRVEEKMLLLSGAIGIFQVEQDCFRYGVEWQVPSRINFRDFKQIVKAVIDGRLTLGNTIPKHISVHAHYRNTYYASLLSEFFEKFEFKSINSREREKNYVLIVDEINRANLSSVLGELIYALEYRGKEVNSMYKVEDSDKLILPPNLYIIGTMNTADRSVGHIDYAIRRRFAFVDVLPKDLSDDDTIIFHKGLFEKVSTFFIENYDEYLKNEKIPLKSAATLSSEFRPEDVWLGHSYFIQKKEERTGVLIPNDFNIRLQYEIKPILLEYIKDGILVGENIKDEILKLGTSI